MSTREYRDEVNRGGKTHPHPKCGTGFPDEIERRKLDELQLWFLTADARWQLPQAPASMTSLL